MNPQSTSFIPKGPTKHRAKGSGVRKIYILTYFSYVFFFGATLAAMGVFFYSITLDTQLEKEKTLLAQERDKFSQSDIESVKELEKRINTVKDRMDKHVSVPAIFEAFEKSALKSLEFGSFSYERSQDAAPLVTITGNSNSFDNILFQKEVLQSNPIFTGATFTGVSLDLVADGVNRTQQVVSFEVNQQVAPSLIPYTPRLTAPDSGDEQISQDASSDNLE